MELFYKHMNDLKGWRFKLTKSLNKYFSLLSDGIHHAFTHTQEIQRKTMHVIQCDCFLI